jgi:hypothetical protein
LRAHWLDVAIVVLTIPLLGEVLGWLRLARFLRYARFGAILARAIQAERQLTSGDVLNVYVCANEKNDLFAISSASDSARIEERAA